MSESTPKTSRSTPKTRAKRFLKAWQALDRAAEARYNAGHEFNAAALAIARKDGIHDIGGHCLFGPLNDWEPGRAPKSLAADTGESFAPFAYLDDGGE